MKKGEVQQVFIYLMVIVVAGAVLLLGYSAVNSIIVKGCDVEKSGFLSQLKRDFTRNERPGSSSLVEIMVPCSYDQVCFVDSGASVSDARDQVIQDNIQAGTGINIFLVERGFTEPFASIADLTVTDKVLCVNASAGHFRFWLTGIGRGAVQVDRE